MRYDGVLILTTLFSLYTSCIFPDAPIHPA